MKGYKEKFYKILEEIKNLSTSFYGDRCVSIVVFGSVAKDRFSPTSDIDLIVILKNYESNYKNYEEFFENIIEKLSYKDVHINPIFKTPENLSVKLPYLWDTEFIILYDKDSFFKNFIKNIENFKKKNLKFKDTYIEVHI